MANIQQYAEVLSGKVIRIHETPKPLVKAPGSRIYPIQDKAYDSTNFKVVGSSFTIGSNRVIRDFKLEPLTKEEKIKSIKDHFSEKTASKVQDLVGSNKAPSILQTESYQSRLSELQASELTEQETSYVQNIVNLRNRNETIQQILEIWKVKSLETIRLVSSAVSIQNSITDILRTPDSQIEDVEVFKSQLVSEFNKLVNL